LSERRSRHDCASSKRGIAAKEMEVSLPEQKLETDTDGKKANRQQDWKQPMQVRLY